MQLQKQQQKQFSEQELQENRDARQYRSSKIGSGFIESSKIGRQGGEQGGQYYVASAGGATLLEDNNLYPAEQKRTSKIREKKTQTLSPKSI